MKKENLNPHKNHRQRLYETINTVGLENVNDYLALEFILTYIVPRKDTNPIAHNLLDKFGSISNVLESSIQDLVDVDGVGERTAKYLTMLPQILNRYSISKAKNSKYLKTTQDIINYCYYYLINKSVEEIYAVFLDKNGKILKTSHIARGEVSTVSFDKSAIIKIALTTNNVASVIITHCHLNGICSPSTNDLHASTFIENTLGSIGIKLLDSVIICNSEGYSFARNQKYKVEL